MVRSAMVENMGVAVGIMSVCCWKLSYIDQQKIFDFSTEGASVFQVAPGNGKGYVLAENVKTSGIGPSRNRLTAF